MLIIFSGLPGTGKTEIATRLARELGGVYLRIDSIEQAMRESRVVRDSLDDAGYRVAYAVAADNLRLGRTVIADSVNPIQLTRDAWAGVAKAADVSAIEIEVTCSDTDEHRRRVETRVPDIAGFRLPSWQDVVTRNYEPWKREHVVVDTGTRTIEQSVALLVSAMSGCLERVDERHLRAKS